MINEYKNNDKYFKELEIREIFIQIVKGLKYLHKNKIIHCNLKSSNILLFKNGKAKIGNLNKSIKSERGLEINYVFSPWSFQYESPEKQHQKPINNKTDIWSLGCILYEMTTLNLPFKDRNIYDISINILNYKVNKLPVQFSNNLYDIISSLIQIISSKRPNCEKILNHRFLKNVNNMNIIKIDNKVNKFIQDEELKINENNYLEKSIKKINNGRDNFENHEKKKIFNKYSRNNEKKNLKKQLFKGNFFLYQLISFII